MNRQQKLAQKMVNHLNHAMLRSKQLDSGTGGVWFDIHDEIATIKRRAVFYAIARGLYVDDKAPDL